MGIGVGKDQRLARQAGVDLAGQLLGDRAVKGHRDHPSIKGIHGEVNFVGKRRQIHLARL